MKSNTGSMLLASFLIIVLLVACNGGNDNKSGAGDQTRELVYTTAKDINVMNPYLNPRSIAAQWRHKATYMGR